MTITQAYELPLMGLLFLTIIKPLCAPGIVYEYG